MTEKEQAAMRQALEALKKARDRIVEAGGSGWKLEAQRCVNAITAMRQALEQQPADEPVSEHSLADVRCECCGYMTYHREHMGCIKAARPQPAAQWVGLTPDEIQNAWNLYRGTAPFSFARAIEAKLREKNTGEKK